MIKGNAGAFTATCDSPGCGVVEDGDQDTFKDFVAYLKSQGWIISKSEMGWSHHCSRDCMLG